MQLVNEILIVGQAVFWAIQVGVVVIVHSFIEAFIVANVNLAFPLFGRDERVLIVV
jgi:hypothetical protein